MALGTLPRVTEFFRALTRRAAKHGWLSLWVLRLNGRMVAIEYQLQAQGTVQALWSGVKPMSQGRLPPYALSLALLPGLFAGSRVYEYYSPPGADSEDLWWATGSHELIHLQVYRPGLYARLLQRWTRLDGVGLASRSPQGHLSPDASDRSKWVVWGTCSSRKQFFYSSVYYHRARENLLWSRSSWRREAKPKGAKPARPSVSTSQLMPLSSGIEEEIGVMHQPHVTRSLTTYAGLIAAGLLVILLVSCAHTTGPLPVASDHEALPEIYLVGPTDVLEVLVWKNEALSRVVTVRPDGYFSLPLIGDVEAAGLTPMQIRDHVSETLTTYYKDTPQVSVIVQQSNSAMVYVLGEVQRPGPYPLRSKMTMLQAITSAGGFTPFASTDNITLLRGANGANQSINISFKDILSDYHLDKDPFLHSGDIVVIR